MRDTTWMLLGFVAVWALAEGAVHLVAWLRRRPDASLANYAQLYQEDGPEPEQFP